MDKTFQSIIGFDSTIKSKYTDYINECKQEIINKPELKQIKRFGIMMTELPPEKKMEIAESKLSFYNIACECNSNLIKLKAGDLNNMDNVKAIRNLECRLLHALRQVLCKFPERYSNDMVTNGIHSACEWKDESSIVIMAKELIAKHSTIHYLENECGKCYSELYNAQKNNDLSASNILLYTLLNLYNVTDGPYIMDEIEGVPLDVFNDPRYKKIVALQLAISKLEDEDDNN